MELDITGERPAEALSRGVVAQRLFEGVGDAAGIGDESLSRLGERHQIQREISEETHRGLDTGGEERARRHQDLALRQRLAVDAGDDEARDQIVRRMVAALVDDALGEIG